MKNIFALFWCFWKESRAERARHKDEVLHELLTTCEWMTAPYLHAPQLPAKKKISQGMTTTAGNLRITLNSVGNPWRLRVVVPDTQSSKPTIGVYISFDSLDSLVQRRLCG